LDQLALNIIFLTAAVAGLIYYAAYRARHRDLAHLRRGMRLESLGEHEQAIDALTEALKINPDLLQARLTMAYACRNLGRLDEATALCRQVADSLDDEASETIGVLELLGRLCSQTGKGEQAVAAYERLIKIWPRYVDGRMALAAARSSVGQHETALALYKELASDCGPSVALCYKLGDLYRLLGRRDEAVEAYEKALAIQLADRHDAGGFAHTLMILGDTYTQFGEHDSALEAYARAQQPDPHWAAPYCGVGDVLIRLGRYDEAMASFRQAIEVDDTWEDAWRGVGDVHAKQNRAQDGLAAYRRAIEINPQFAAAHLDMGRLLAALGETEEAKKSLGKACELDPHGEVGKESRAALDELSTPRLSPDK